MSNFNLTDVSKKDRSWDKMRSLVDPLICLLQGTEFERNAERIAGCALELSFRLSQCEDSDSGEMQLYLQTAWFCRVRLCPICQWRKSLMWKARFLKALPKILNDYPTARWIFLTLTVPNCELAQLQSTINWMNKSWKRLSERKVFPAIGYVKSFECTLNRLDGSAHPHFHALLMVPPVYFSRNYLSHEKWVELWKDCLRLDRDPIVNIKAVKPKNESDAGDTKKALQSAIAETLKYSVKPEDYVNFSPEQIVELTKQIHKVRAVALGGVMREYLREIDPDNLIHPTEEVTSESESDDPIWDFNWDEKKKRYTGGMRNES